MTNALVERKESKIAAWGDRNEIREIARRVQLMAPGAKKLSEEEALALAQGAVAHGLDPFNGEIWYIPGSGLMAGIKGLRKAAREQLKGNYWCEFNQITDPDVMAQLDIPRDALAFECVLRDSETITAYSESFKRMNEQNVPIDVILDVLGSRPYTTGYGYVESGEKSRMTPIQLARKRAEADAIKRRFDLPFVFGNGESEIVDGDFTLIEDAESSEDPELAIRARAGREALYGADEIESEPIQIDSIKSLKSKALTDPVSISPTEYWTVARHYGIDTEQGKQIYAELGNWADALIKLVEMQESDQ